MARALPSLQPCIRRSLCGNYAICNPVYLVYVHTRARTRSISVSLLSRNKRRYHTIIIILSPPRTRIIQLTKSYRESLRLTSWRTGRPLNCWPNHVTGRWKAIGPRHVAGQHIAGSYVGNMMLKSTRFPFYESANYLAGCFIAVLFGNSTGKTLVQLGSSLTANSLGCARTKVARNRGSVEADAIFLRLWQQVSWGRGAIGPNRDVI